MINLFSSDWDRKLVNLLKNYYLKVSYDKRAIYISFVRNGFNAVYEG